MTLQDCVWENHHQIIMKTIFTALKFGSLIYSFASSFENSGSQGSSGQGMGKIGENLGVEPDKSQRQERSDR